MRRYGFFRRALHRVGQIDRETIVELGQTIKQRFLKKGIFANMSAALEKDNPIQINYRNKEVVPPTINIQELSFRFHGEQSIINKINLKIDCGYCKRPPKSAVFLTISMSSYLSIA
jgi:ABC-type transport system involved in cytochrome bd biosynthesis fused ATPase/permease subunit